MQYVHHGLVGIESAYLTIADNEKVRYNDGSGGSERDS